jgi:hypothetical protein
VLEACGNPQVPMLDNQSSVHPTEGQYLASNTGSISDIPMLVDDRSYLLKR